MNNIEVTQAQFAEDYSHIIDSDGYRVELNDPRVTHIFAPDGSSYSFRIINNLFEKYGRKCRFSSDTDIETIQYSKQLCSGRECLPCLAIAGTTVKDIQNNREEDEISIYYNLDAGGPCQYGAWPVIWDTFAERLNLKNVIFCKLPHPDNNLLGLEKEIGIGSGLSVFMGDLLDEARNTLKCLAVDREEAMEIFDKETALLIDSIKNGIKAFKPALKEWAENTSKIPLKATAAETPKVLIFGGLNVIFVNYPVTDYFIEQGVIPKVIDASEGSLWLGSEIFTRYGFKRGLVTPKRQFNIKSLLFSSIIERKNRKEALAALQFRLAMSAMDFFKKRYRKIMERSGLVFDLDIPFRRIAHEGSKYVSYNGFCETPVTTGRYVCSVKDGLFDGLVNLGSFNCQPAMNSQAIIRPLANTDDIPYIALDCEGPWISANQLRLLETIAVQARRVREKKNERYA